MAFNGKYITDLQDIVNLISNNQVHGEHGAIAKFTDYLNLVINVGPFTRSTWNKDWRKKIYHFGETFKDKHHLEFIHQIDIILESRGSIEILEFIKSEIAFNITSDDVLKKYILTLVERYPFNPEFRHNLGHFYKRENSMLEAIEEYKLSLKIEPDNHSFRKSRFSADWVYVRTLIEDGKYESGKKFVQEILNERIYEGDLWHNEFISQLSRLEDHISFQNKIAIMENQFKEKISSALDNERKRIIEILGFFSAIIAFILSTVSIGKDFKFSEAIYFIFGLGIILILFAVTMSLFFSTSNTKIFKDYKFWILTISIISLLIFIVNISDIVCIIC